MFSIYKVCRRWDTVNETINCAEYLNIVKIIVSPSTIASICVALRSFCCDSRPLALSLVIPHLSLPPFCSLHPCRPLMPSSRVGERGRKVDRITAEGRTGAGPTEMAREILACPDWEEEVWRAAGGGGGGGGGGVGGGFCSVWCKNWPGSLSSGWTTASFTRV